MKRTVLKKLRLRVGMTQKQVADAMGISQPNYQRWEAGTSPTPSTKVKKLAQILQTSVEKIQGKPEPFDILGVDKSIKDSRKYFGEVAIHFGGKGLLLPISEEARSILHRQLQSGAYFISVESLDNRLVFIRSTAIKDIYISSEAFDTFGPETYESHQGVRPDDEYWRVVENMEDPDFLVDELDQSFINKVLSEVILTDEELDELVISGDVKPEDREEIRKDANEKTEEFFQRATCICWQLSSGAFRCESAYENKKIFEAFNSIELDDSEEFIYLPIEGYHRTIFIRKSEIDYIWAPKHKFNDGQLEAHEEELDDQ